MIICPLCESTEIETTMVNDELQYGTAAVIPVIVPLRTCKCGFQFLDSEAEDMFTKALQTYLSTAPKLPQ